MSKLMRVFLAVFGAVFLAASMAGCMNVKLKTEIPAVVAYDVGAWSFGAGDSGADSKCASLKPIVLLSVKIAPKFDSQKVWVLDAHTLKTHAKESAKWASSPKNMAESALKSALLEACFMPIGSHADLPARLESSTIAVEVLRFEIVESSLDSSADASESSLDSSADALESSLDSSADASESVLDSSAGVAPTAPISAHRSLSTASPASAFVALGVRVNNNYRLIKRRVAITNGDFALSFHKAIASANAEIIQAIGK